MKPIERIRANNHNAPAYPPRVLQQKNDIDLLLRLYDAVEEFKAFADRFDNAESVPQKRMYNALAALKGEDDE